ncbi:hypothetical protein BGZ81_011433 [Podila clonocystis]|nr:hypothetical protein BGZ81_011433 [Podila clonocystis]
MSSELPSYQASDDAYTRIIHFLETSLSFIPGVSDAEQETTLEDKLRTIQRAMQDHDKDIMRLRAERNRAIDDAKRFMANRTVLQAKRESLVSVKNTIQADLKRNFMSSQTPSPHLLSPSSSYLPIRTCPSIRTPRLSRRSSSRPPLRSLSASRHDQDHLHEQVVFTTKE